MISEGFKRLFRLLILYLLIVAIGAALNWLVFDDPPFERSTFTIGFGVLLGLTFAELLRKRRKNQTKGFGN